MQYNKSVLPNGLTLLMVPMSSFESATVLVMVGAGSRYETKNNNGISHFLEHMAFKGTTKRPSAMDIASLIDGIGGEFNAFTSKEITGYYIKSAAHNVELSLDILADMLQNSKLDQEEIDKEKGVIIEEINMYEDTPMRKIGDIYESLLYGDTPMGWDIAGEKGVIKGITRNDFITYMNSFYSPSNMTVVVAGGIDLAKVEQDVHKYFGQMKKFPTKKFNKVTESQSMPEVLIKQKVTEQVHIAIGVRTTPLESKERYPLSILSAILGGGMSSRLFHEVRERRGLAYYVRTHSDHYQDVGSLVTTAGVDAKRVEDAIKVICDQYKKIWNDFLPTDSEMKKAKEFLKGHLVLELEDSRSVAGFYAHQELLESEIKNPDGVISQIDSVNKDQVIEAAKIFLSKPLNLAIIGNFTDKAKFEKLLQ